MNFKNDTTSDKTISGAIVEIILPKSLDSNSEKLMIENKNILIIDDEIDICKLISGVLEDEGYQTLQCPKQ